jgi:hypothetical protein
MNALPNRVLLRTAHTVQPCIWKTLVYSMYVSWQYLILWFRVEEFGFRVSAIFVPVGCPTWQRAILLKHSSGAVLTSQIAHLSRPLHMTVRMRHIGQRDRVHSLRKNLGCLKSHFPGAGMCAHLLEFEHTLLTRSHDAQGGRRLEAR